MRMSMNIVKVILIGGVLCVSCSRLQAEVEATLGSGGKMLILENAMTRIEYALDRGVFDVYDKTN